MNDFRVLIALIFLASAQGMLVDGPGNHWIRNGGSQTLICRSESPISTCSWETPYKGLYTFGAAKIAEGGRIKDISSESGDELQCGIAIEPLDAKDEGSWICHVGTVNSEGELETGVGSGKLSIAAEPSEVVIEKSDMKMNDSMGNNTDFLKINCVVKGAKPEPSFTWFLEEELMENPEVETEQFEDDWIQTLILSPKDFNGNASLKCSVTHFGLAEPLEVDTIIGMNLDVEPSKTIVIGEAPIPLKYIAFVPLILLLFVPIHVYAYRRQNREFFNTHCAKFFSRSSTDDEPVDLEKGENGSDEAKDEKKDEEKPVEDPEVNDQEDVADNEEKKESAWKRLKAWMAPKQLKEKKLVEELEKVEDMEVGEDTVDVKKEESTEEKVVDEDTNEKLEEVKEESKEDESS